MNTPRASQWDAFGDFAAGTARRSSLTADELETARRREAAPLALGLRVRSLLDEIDSYLEFFAIARAA
jgi:hypothetical protein